MNTLNSDRKLNQISRGAIKTLMRHEQLKSLKVCVWGGGINAKLKELSFFYFFYIPSMFWWCPLGDTEINHPTMNGNEFGKKKLLERQFCPKPTLPLIILIGTEFWKKYPFHGNNPSPPMIVDLLHELGICQSGC